MTEQISFRNWLLERLVNTEWARHSGNVERTAKKIGVQADLLLQARARFREECAANGMPLPKQRHLRHSQYKIVMPEPVFVVWRAHAEARGVHPEALMRSLIHEYLLGDQEPSVLLRQWLWKGRLLSVDDRTWEQKNKGAYPYRQRTLLTNGARRALDRRAKRVGCAPAAVVRGLILDTLEGKHPRVKIVDARTMYDDEDKYLNPSG